VTPTYLDIFVLPNVKTPAIRLPMYRGREGITATVVMTQQEAIDCATILALNAMKNGASVQTGVILPVNDTVRRATQGEAEPSPYTLRERQASTVRRLKAPAKQGKSRQRPQAVE
jgi:hypothetical protein